MENLKDMEKNLSSLVKNQFTRKFVIIERIVLLFAISVRLLIRTRKIAAFCLVACDL